MKRHLLLTCEHAGNEVPADYRHLFKGKEEILFSHKAMDFGALRLAKHLSSEIHLPLHYTRISRLLVEANRSLESDELFSDYSIGLSEKEKQAILSKFYHPHRKMVEEVIRQEVAVGKQVVHLAIHSFTPVLDGEVREADIGILFDPKRPSEKELAQNLQSKFSDMNQQRKVCFNLPYPGSDDGFPTYLRNKFSDKEYAGFEIEVNQKLFLHGEPEVWYRVVEEITDALKVVKEVAGSRN
jgi:predicted N-formylglutamate amidohydrolase